MEPCLDSWWVLGIWGLPYLAIPKQPLLPSSSQWHDLKAWGTRVVVENQKRKYRQYIERILNISLAHLKYQFSHPIISLILTVYLFSGHSLSPVGTCCQNNDKLLLGQSWWVDTAGSSWEGPWGGDGGVSTILMEVAFLASWGQGCHLNSCLQPTHGLPSNTASAFHERVLQGFDRPKASVSSRNTDFRLSSSLIRNWWNHVNFCTSKKFRFMHEELVNICHCPVSQKTNSSISVSSCVGKKWAAAGSDLSVGSWEVPPRHPQ